MMHSMPNTSTTKQLTLWGVYLHCTHMYIDHIGIKCAVDTFYLLFASTALSLFYRPGAAVLLLLLMLLHPASAFLLIRKTARQQRKCVHEFSNS